MKAHDAIIRFLEAEDVDTVFSLMSEDTKLLLSKLRTDVDGMRVVEARHEQHAVGMADGYARIADGIGVCVIGRGPGIAQTGTSMKTTHRRGSGVLVLVPGSPLSTTYEAKDFAQESYLRTMFEDDVVLVDSHETLVPEFAEVFRKLRLGDGPIAVQVPWDVLDGEMPGGGDAVARIGAEVEETTPPSDGAHVQPDAERIRAALELYLDSDASVPPMILAGRGAVDAGARDAIGRLAERMGAMLATTLQGRGYFSDHPFSVGFVGDFGSTLANEFLSRSDFVLAIGCSLNPHTMDKGRLISEDATVVHVDADPLSIERYTGVDLGIVGDGRVAAQELVAAFDEEGIDFSESFWTSRRRERIADASPLDEREFRERPDRMDPRDVVRTLNRHLPDDRLVVTDGGHFTNWVLDGIEVDHPDDFVWTLDFAAVGQGIPIGVGAALAEEERTCVAVCGDAGFMMTLQEVDTAARYDVPLSIVVMNDGALGSEFHQLDLVDAHTEAALVDAPDIATISAGLGADSYTVRSQDELDAVADEFDRSRGGPLVVDCHINHEVRHRAYDELFAESH